MALSCNTTPRPAIISKGCRPSRYPIIIARFLYDTIAKVIHLNHLLKQLLWYNVIVVVTIFCFSN